jgi:TM2 domain-containing membrane protein YozV
MTPQSELAPEERRRIYLEEKARMEIRHQLAAEQPPQKSNGVAALLSFVIPGVGQMYKEKVGAGLVWFFATVAGYCCFIVPGAMLHLCCIFNAYSTEVRVDQNTTPQPPPPLTPEEVTQMHAQNRKVTFVILALVILIAVGTVLSVGRIRQSRAKEPVNQYRTSSGVPCTKKDWERQFFHSLKSGEEACQILPEGKPNQ